MKMIQFVFLAVMSLFATMAYAHPGEHSMTMSQLVEHLLTSGFHLALIAGGMLSLAVIVYRSWALFSPRRVRSSRR